MKTEYFKLLIKNSIAAQQAGDKVATKAIADVPGGATKSEAPRERSSEVAA